MKKRTGLLIFLFCLMAGGILSVKPSKAVEWNEKKMTTVKKGAFTFRAFFSKDKKKAATYLT